MSDTWRCQTEHGDSDANNGVFDVIKLGTFHQNASLRGEGVGTSLLPEQVKNRQLSVVKVLVN